MENIDISVIIPVKDGQRYLGAVLDGVYSQDIGCKFEVTIIDSGSSDRTLDIITQYPVKLFQIQEGDFNHGLTRNFGISRSQGKYIILMTADAIPYDNNWMMDLVGNLENDGRVAGVYSRQIPHRDSSLLTKVRVGRFFTSSLERRISQVNKLDYFEKLPPKEKHKLCNFDTVSSCIRKEIWEKFPFSETDFAEDLGWSKKVLMAGYKIIYEPRSIVYHSHDFSVFDWYNKSRINSNKLFILFNVDTIRNPLGLFKAFCYFTLRDTVSIYKKTKSITSALANIPLIILYSFFGALGQYRGTKSVLRQFKPL